MTWGYNDADKADICTKPCKAAFATIKGGSDGARDTLLRCMKDPSDDQKTGPSCFDKIKAEGAQVAEMFGTNNKCDPADVLSDDTCNDDCTGAMTCGCAMTKARDVGCCGAVLFDDAIRRGVANSEDVTDAAVACTGDSTPDPCEKKMEPEDEDCMFDLTVATDPVLMK